MEITCERMRRLTEEALRTDADGGDVRQVAQEVTAHQAPGAGAVHDELVRNLDADGDR